ncbi:MAG: VanZ family protein [Myxococcales bacterium]|nr:VanZ family protein [Myxococcales bacterium]
MGVTGDSPVAVRAWVAAGAWMLLILWLSSDQFSANTTGSLLQRLLAFLGAELTRGALHAVHFAVRKAAHLAEYAVLGALTLRALASSVPNRRAPLWAWLLALCVALVDEGYQSTSPVRTGSLRDVGVDGVGALIGVAAQTLRAAKRSAR